MKSDTVETYEANDQRVLLFLVKSRDAASLPLVLERAGFASTTCGTADDVCGELDRGAGALLVYEEMIVGNARQCLLAALEGQPAWSELPIIVLQREGGETQASREALQLPGEVTLIELPVRVNTLVSAIRNALRSRRRQYQVRDQLRALEQSYRTLFDAIDEGFCTVEVIFDASGKPVDYRFLTTNRSFEKHTGISSAQGKFMREIAPEHEEHWFETYGGVALTGESVRFEDRAEKLQRWFDVHAFRIGRPDERQVGIVFYDITSRKQAELELHRAKEELEARVRERTQELTRALQRLEAETDERIRAVDELNAKDQLLCSKGGWLRLGS